MESHLVAVQMFNEVISKVSARTKLDDYRNPLDIVSERPTDISARGQKQLAEKPAELKVISENIEEELNRRDSEKRTVEEDAEFKAEDIFSDLTISPEVLPEKFAVNETTQTSQSLGQYLVDAWAQTSEGLIADMPNNKTVQKEKLQMWSPKERTIKDSLLYEDEQVVPDLVQFNLPPPGSLSSSGRRRLGLSKRARLNPLHRNRF